MLKGIPSILSPQLMLALMEMGHGDELVIADANFPAVSNAKRIVRCDGHGIPELLTAIMQFFPLDQSVEFPVLLMEPADEQSVPPIWSAYREIIHQSGEPFQQFGHVGRFAFYERSRQAFAVVTTGEKASRGNLILKMGVVR